MRNLALAAVELASSRAGCPPPPLGLEIYIYSECCASLLGFILDNRIFPFFLREVICIAILPFSLGSKETPSCPSWLPVNEDFHLS